MEAERRLGDQGADAREPRPRCAGQPNDGPALPSGLSAPQPLADNARVARAWGDAGRTIIAGQRNGDPDRTRRSRRHGLSRDFELPRHPRLQLFEFLRDLRRSSGGRDCETIDSSLHLESGKLSNSMLSNVTPRTV